MAAGAGATPRSLTRRRDFQKVYEEGRKLVSRSFVLHLLPAPDLARAVVASKKVGGAVQRNRAKRLLRHMLQAVFFADAAVTATAIAAALGAAAPGSSGGRSEPGLWIVAVARRAILETNIHALTAEARERVEELCGDCPTR